MRCFLRICKSCPGNPRQLFFMECRQHASSTLAAKQIVIAPAKSDNSTNSNILKYQRESRCYRHAKSRKARTFQQHQVFPELCQPSVWMTLLGSTLPRMIACSVALGHWGRFRHRHNPLRLSRPKTMVFSPVPRSRLPRMRFWGQSRIHRPQARLRTETERCTAEPGGHGYAGTPH